jgi:NAD-dependent DNA ligase
MLTQEQLEDDILYHKYLYYEKSNPIISDYNYDLLEKELKKRFPESKILSDAKYNECPREFWSKFEKRYKEELKFLC